MIDYAEAQAACETYIRSLQASDVETLLALFDDNASIEDPVGTELREGKSALREFYSVACEGVLSAALSGATFGWERGGFPLYRDRWDKRLAPTRRSCARAVLRAIPSAAAA